MRVIVTGGAGFIGSNFIRLLLRERPEWHILNLDKLTYAGNLDNLADVTDSPQYTFVKADIADGPAVERILDGFKPDSVLNFAAESHVDRSIEEPAPFLRTNIEGTQILLEACRRRDIGRFVQISTDEVYGSLGSQGSFTEDSPIQPNSPYAASKAAADLICRAYGETYGYRVTVTRSSNNFGPYQFPEKLIPLMTNNALADKELPVYGEGANVRDWIHVEDNCRGILAALERGQPGRVYNIGGGNELPNIELVRMLLEILGKPESLIKFVRDRPGHDFRYSLDSSRARAELGWQPLIGFEDGLRSTAEWYRQNRQWCEKILSGEYLEYYKRMYGDR
ncbi:MAG TPA: dTDP-glucose 4,6-dehydratase [Acidobacteriota bacterium]|nr:dTDP-glucose 4,6-dehydratase [Acidobacteriota bacterium]